MCVPLQCPSCNMCSVDSLSLLTMPGGRELGESLLPTYDDDDGLLHIVAGVKRLLMKLKSREMFSGTWLQPSH